MTNHHLDNITITELRDDLAEAQADIKVCELALLHDVTTYSGGSVQARLDSNRRVVAVITAELQRRGDTQVQP